jgi:hypothetical protein
VRPLLPLLLFLISSFEHSQAQSNNDSYCESQEHLIRAGKVHFFGTWADYFSSFLKLNSDSSFTYSWGFAGKSCHTAGKWTRIRDSFYFHARDSLIISETDCPFPKKLIYYNHKFYQADGTGNLFKGKIPSAYMGKKIPLFKTHYFWDKKYNLGYFDSLHYQGSLNHTFRIGTGINNVLQPVSGYPVVYSFGFVFSPRYLFARKENSYLSLGTPFTLGFSGIGDSVNGGPHFGIMLDLPLIFNYNHPFGSLEQGGSRFEYFAGGGAAYHYNHYSVSENPNVALQQVNGFGPVVNAGIRYSISRYRIKNFELKFSYIKMIVKSRPDIVGIAFIVNF